MRGWLEWLAWLLDTDIDGLPAWVYIVAGIAAVATVYLADKAGML